MREAKCIKVNICRHLHLLHHIIEASRVLLKISSDFREMFHQIVEMFHQNLGI